MTQYDLYLYLKAWILKYCFFKLYKLNENTEDFFLHTQGRECSLFDFA